LLMIDGDSDAAAAEVANAIGLDPESYEVNRSAGRLSYQLEHHAEAIRYFEKSAALMETDIYSPSMLISCYSALGDQSEKLRVAQLTLDRCERILAHDPNNVAVTGDSAYALAALGEGERAKSRMSRALVIDPDNLTMRYNFVCALSIHLLDKAAALEMFRPVCAVLKQNILDYAKVDPDLNLLRDDPRFMAMIAGAESRMSDETALQTIGPVRSEA